MLPLPPLQLVINHQADSAFAGGFLPRLIFARLEERLDLRDLQTNLGFGFHGPHASTTGYLMRPMRVARHASPALYCTLLRTTIHYATLSLAYLAHDTLLVNVSDKGERLPQ